MFCVCVFRVKKEKKRKEMMGKGKKGKSNLRSKLLWIEKAPHLIVYAPKPTYSPCLDTICEDQEHVLLHHQDHHIIRSHNDTSS